MHGIPGSVKYILERTRVSLYCSGPSPRICAVDIFPIQRVPILPPDPSIVNQVAIFVAHLDYLGYLAEPEWSRWNDVLNFPRYV